MAKKYEWSKFYHGAIPVIRKRKITIAEFDLLMLLVEQSAGRKGNIAYVTPTSLSDELGRSRSNISVELRKLCKLNVIGKTSKGYMVNPMMFFSGDDDDHRIAVASYLNNFGTTAVNMKGDTGDEQE